jgi:ATP-dependent RNA helicase SUPV3L1/SUV3
LGLGCNDNRRPDDQKGDRAKFQQLPREDKREKAFDPDSPFAKLMALKAPKGQ